MKPDIQAQGGPRPPSRAERLAAIRVSRRFRAPPEQVFDAWLDPAVAGQWLFATAWRPMARVAIDARVAGRFRFASRRGGSKHAHTGRYLEIDPPRRLVFSLSTAKRPRAVTRVSVELVPRDRGCELILTHEQLPPDHASHAKARWTGMLYGLGETLDRNGSTQD
ncbi:MAG TPA: SRPBCC domain-containing protein [Acidiferrobacterales bacterium]|jgi:uncharacterized protein YndB with AHSA1/START domain